jgi:methionyl-tRNA formyltransferase
VNVAISIFADDYVGFESVKFLFKNYPDDISSVIVNGDDSVILKYLVSEGFDSSRIYIFSRGQTNSLLSFLKSKGKIDYIILAWWPFIINEEVISIPNIGAVNMHPSLLPYNRGKHYNFWAIVEQCPFGVSIHMVDKGIDSGDILFQKEIEIAWTDTGETLYFKARDRMIELFCDAYPDLRSNNFIRKPQELTIGSFHLANQLDKASEIDLEKTYKAKDLINLIRARTFSTHPACRFTDETGTYEIRSSINKI